MLCCCGGRPRGRKAWQTPEEGQRATDETLPPTNNNPEVPPAASLCCSLLCRQRPNHLLFSYLGLNPHQHAQHLKDARTPKAPTADLTSRGPQVRGKVGLLETPQASSSGG